jgi:hypothetical protein
MPKTKKPRKAFDPHRWRKSPRIMSAKDVDDIKAAYRNVELAVELRLHTGGFTKDDLLNLGSMILLGTFVMYRGYGLEHEYCILTYGQEWVAMQEAYKTYKDRALRTGSYACTGDELKAIRDGVEIAGTMIQVALNADPIRVAELWVLTELSGDMPQKASEGLKWMDRKLKEIRRFRGTR